MSELSQINTPSDLVEFNKPVDPCQALLEQIYELGPVQGKDIALQIIDKLNGWHEYMVEQRIDEGENQNACTWAADGAKLEVVYTLLKSIEV